MKIKTKFKSAIDLSLLRIILLITFLMICRTLSAQLNNTFFKVTYATSQSWAGGAAGSGSGIYYNFHIVCKKTATIHFDSVWIDNSYRALFSRSAMLIEKSTFNKGDSILLSSEVRYPGKKDPMSNVKQPAKMPKPCKECKSSVIILFRVNGKLYYYDVNKVTGLKPINYP